MAPAICALSAFCLKEQLPRSSRATLPLTTAPLTSASQASFTSGAVPSTASTRVPVVAENDCGPKPATPTAGLRLPGCTVSVLAPTPSHTNMCMRGDIPSAGTTMLELLRCVGAPSCPSARRGSPSMPPRP